MTQPTTFSTNPGTLLLSVTFALDHRQHFHIPTYLGWGSEINANSKLHSNASASTLALRLKPQLPCE